MKTNLFFALSVGLVLSGASSYAASANPYSAVAPADSVDLTSYAGTYSFGEVFRYRNMSLLWRGAPCTVKRIPMVRNKLLKQPDADTFKSTSSYGSIIVFKRDPATKKVTSLILKIMDQEVPAKKEK